MDQTPRAAIYCRISDDRSGQGLGVARQRQDCEALASREGWPVVEVFTDNDLSAYSGRERPAYQRLLRALAFGGVHAVVAWHPDRLHRSPRELEDFIDAVEKAGAQVRTVTAGVVDLSTAAGRMTARVAAAVARHESDQKAERVRRKMRELAEEGRSNGGPRTFGYEGDHVTVREEEALLVREAAKRALSGETLRSVAHDWNERHIPTVRGASGWSYQAMRRMLLSPRHAGLRSHRGVVVGPAEWLAIIERDVHEKLKVVLAPKPRSSNGARNRLLSGLAYCGRCGGRLASRVDGKGTRSYRCTREPGRGQDTNCGQLSVVSGPLDELVGEAVLASLAGPGLAEAINTATGDDEERQELTARLSADELRLETLAEDFADGALTRGEWRAARERLLARIQRAKEQLSSDVATETLAHLPSGEAALRHRWSAADVPWRHAVVRSVVERVDVAPKGHRGGKVFDPGRVSIRWRV